MYCHYNLLRVHIQGVILCNEHILLHSLLNAQVYITVTRAEIDEWTDTFYNTAWRVARHPEPFTPNDVKGIYERTLAKFIVD